MNEAKNFEVLIKRHCVEAISLATNSEYRSKYEEILNDKEEYNKIIDKIMLEINDTKDAYLKLLELNNREEAKELVNKINSDVPKIIDFIKLKLDCWRNSTFRKEFAIDGKSCSFDHYSKKLNEITTVKEELLDLINKVENQS